MVLMRNLAIRLRNRGAVSMDLQSDFYCSLYSQVTAEDEKIGSLLKSLNTG